MLIEPQTHSYRTAREIIRDLHSRGFEAVFAGGCVRDLITGEKPKDYDIATNASPEEIQEIFPRTKPVGANFGVVLVLKEGKAFEVATFRTEDSYTDGRHPENVNFTDLEQDARRRDFTINGMYWDPVAQELIDLIGGREDLKKGILRAIGKAEERFREDHLRIIRAVRFAGRLDLNIETETRAALGKLSDLVTEVSAERLRDELKIILTDKNPTCSLRLMDQLGMFTDMFPELRDTKGCEQPENYHPEGDVFVHTLLTVQKLGPHPSFELAMAALLHDVGKPAASREQPKHFPEHERIGEEIAQNVCRRLKLSKNETANITWLVKRHMYFNNADKMKDSTLKKLFAEPLFDDLCEIVRADAMASWKCLDHLNYVLKKKREFSEEEIEPEPLVDGHDLIEMGYEPGPAFGEILGRIREQQLEGELDSREEALQETRKIADRLGAARTQ